MFRNENLVPKPIPFTCGEWVSEEVGGGGGVIHPTMIQGFLLRMKKKKRKRSNALPSIKSLAATVTATVTVRFRKDFTVRTAEKKPRKPEKHQARRIKKT